MPTTPTEALGDKPGTATTMHDWEDKPRSHLEPAEAPGPPLSYRAARLRLGKQMKVLVTVMAELERIDAALPVEAGDIARLQEENVLTNALLLKAALGTMLESLTEAEVWFEELVAFARTRGSMALEPRLEEALGGLVFKSQDLRKNPV
jgi:hypothetical protein